MRPDPIAVSDRFAELVASYRRRYGGIPQKILTDGVRTLTDMFTGVRGMSPGYLSKHHLRQAYVCYHLAVNWAKVRLVLRELKGFATLPKSPRVLDYGAGPGSASLACIDEFTEPKLTLHDVVSEALDDAKFLIGEYGGAGGRVRLAPGEPEGPFDLVIAANVMSELKDSSPLDRLIEGVLDPDGYLVVVEPALPAPTRRLMEWRDRLQANGWRIAAPCVGATRCPMRDRGDLWCHQDLPWSRPAFIDEVDRRLGFAKESLKFSYLVVTRAGKLRVEAGEGWRVVSNLHRSKGRAWATLCGSGPALVEAELLTRHRSPDTADFEHARRGDVLKIEPAPSGRFAEGAKITRL